MAHENHIALIVDPEDGAIQIVRDQDHYGSVRHLSEGGWTLLAILQERGSETVSLQKDDANGYTKTVQEAVEVTETKLVFRQNKDNTLADLQAERDEAKSRIHTLEDDIQAFKDEQKSVEESVEEATAKVAVEAKMLRDTLEVTKDMLAVAEATVADTLAQLKTAEAERDKAREQLERVDSRVDDFGNRENHIDLVQTAIATMESNGNGEAT
jgi:chromosome segregation ATPase